MGKLLYSAISSLDGYVNDDQGGFEWAAPDAELHAFVNDLVRPVGTHLYGRRMYEVMAAWETMDTASEPAVVQDFASIWRGADKIVYSASLPAASSARTRIARGFDPDAVRRLKAGASRDLSIGGPTLAAEAIPGGLVDEYHLLLAPVVVGGGTRSLPDDADLRLELVDERRFASGFVYLRYRPAG